MEIKYLLRFSKCFGTPQCPVPYAIFDSIMDAKYMAEKDVNNYLREHDVMEYVELVWETEYFENDIVIYETKIEVPYDEQTQKPHPERDINIFYYSIIPQPYYKKT